MGPVKPLETDAAKVFASIYALVSGLVLIGATGILLAPVFHWVLHRFHLEQQNERYSLASSRLSENCVTNSSIGLPGNAQPGSKVDRKLIFTLKNHHSPLLVSECPFIASTQKKCLTIY